MELRTLMEHSFRLYGRRNRIFLSGLRARIDFLNLALGDVQDAVRRDAPPLALGMALARIVSRIFCIAEHFRTLPFVETIARKYPVGRCSYCSAAPCQCVERRGEAKLESALADEQLTWSLGQWCLHLEMLYGGKNREKGIENILNRSFKEISELLSLAMEVESSTSARSLEEIEEEFALELSDALAWAIATANFFGIDLERAFLERYGNGCRRCGENPCRCLNFNMRPLRWTELV